MAQENKTSSNNDEISLLLLLLKIKELCKYLLSRWIIIVCAGILGGATGFIYSFSKKTIYKAELSFALEDDRTASGGLGGAMGLASQFGIDLGNSGGGAFSGDNLFELMKSRSMIEKSLLSTISINNKKTTLVELYISFNRFHDIWKNDPKLKNITFPVNSDNSTFTLQQDSILGVFYNSILKGNLTVDKLDKKSSIIDIKVGSENELFSKYFTEILAKTVSDFYIDTKTKKASQNVSILQRQTDSVRQRLNMAIIGVASSVDVNPNANPSLQILRVPSQRHQVDVQVNTAIFNQLVANLELAKVTLRKETPLIQIIDKPILPLEKYKLSKSKSILIGGIIMGFLSAFIILLQLIYKKLKIDE